VRFVRSSWRLCVASFGFMLSEVTKITMSAPVSTIFLMDWKAWPPGGAYRSIRTFFVRHSWA